MAKIQVFFAADLQGEYPLDDKFEVTVGRGTGCDVIINNYAVSRHHCTIREIKRKWVLYDEGSSNGTYVNGEKITQHELKHNDRVVIGKHTLLFDQYSAGIESTPRAEDQSGDDGTMFVSPDALAKLKDRSKNQQSMALVINSPKRRIQPLTQTVTVIGKSPLSDVKIGGLFVKQEQLVITKTERGYKINSNGGWRAMRINGVKRDTAFLSAGDVITIAGNKISFGSL